MADGTQIDPTLPDPNRHTPHYVATLRTRIDQLLSPLPEARDTQLDSALNRLLLGVERGYVIANSHTREAIADRIATSDIHAASRMLSHITPSNSTPLSALQEASALCQRTARDFGCGEHALGR
jgi:hypothetical protein